MCDGIRIFPPKVLVLAFSISLFPNFRLIPDGASVIPLLFAKSSIVLNPILYIYLNPQVRRVFAFSQTTMRSSSHKSTQKAKSFLYKVSKEEQFFSVFRNKEEMFSYPSKETNDAPPQENILFSAKVGLKSYKIVFSLRPQFGGGGFSDILRARRRHRRRRHNNNNNSRSQNPFGICTDNNTAAGGGGGRRTEPPPTTSDIQKQREEEEEERGDLYDVEEDEESEEEEGREGGMEMAQMAAAGGAAGGRRGDPER